MATKDKDELGLGSEELGEEGLSSHYRVGVSDHRVVAAVASGLGYGPDEYIHFMRGNPLAHERNGTWQAEVHIELHGQYLRGRASVSGEGGANRLIAIQQAAEAAFARLQPPNTA